MAEGRGRKSGAALTTLADGGQIVAIVRPEPPAELSDEQAVEWRAIVERLPADWFQRETHAMLAQYCRHVVSARHIAQLIADYERGEGEFDLKDYDRMLAMHEREGRALSSLATRMRISQQSTYAKDRAKPRTGQAKPWETPEEENGGS